MVSVRRGRTHRQAVIHRTIRQATEAKAWERCGYSAKPIRALALPHLAGVGSIDKGANNKKEPPMHVKVRSSWIPTCFALIVAAVAAKPVNAEIVIWQFEVEVQGLADPTTTEAYFPKQLSVADRERFTIQLSVDTATPPSLVALTDAFYPGAIRSARAFGNGWSLDLPVLSRGSVDLRNEDPPGRDQIFAVATGPLVPGETWFSLQATFDNIRAPTDPSATDPLTSLQFPNPPAALANWNNSGFYYSARRDQPGQQVEGGTYYGRLISFTVLRDTDSDGIFDDQDNCPGTANADQRDSNRDGYGDACVHPTVLVPSSASVNPFVVIGAFSRIGPGVVTRRDVRIGRVAKLATNASLGERVRIGDFVELGESVRIGDDSSVATTTTVGHRAQMVARVTVGARARVAEGAVLCTGAVIGDRAQVRRNALVQTGVVVPAGSIVAGRSTAPTPDMCLPVSGN